MCVCVCVCVCVFVCVYVCVCVANGNFMSQPYYIYIYQTSLLGQDITQGQFLSGV